MILVFLLMFIPALSWNCTILESFAKTCLVVLQIHDRQISPLILYLYLNPLYSMRGGSTTRAEPFTNKLSLVFLRKKPLYN